MNHPNGILQNLKILIRFTITIAKGLHINSNSTISITFLQSH